MPGGPAHRVARGGVERDQVDVGGQRADEAGQLGDVRGPVVHPVDQRPLHREPSVGRRHVVGAGLGQHRQRVPPVDRHQLVAQLVVGGVQGDGEVDRELLAGQPPDARDDADGGEGEAAGRQSEVGVDPLDRRPRAVVVGQRLAHAHEDDVGEATRPGRPRGRHHLLDDLAGGELAHEARLAGGAELARHGAAGLGRDAGRHPVGVGHQHGLHPGPVAQGEEPLDGVAAVGHLSRPLRERRHQRLLQPAAQARREVGHLRRPTGPAVEPVPDLADSVGGLVGEERRQLLGAEVVGSGHHPTLEAGDGALRR